MAKEERRLRHLHPLPLVELELVVEVAKDLVVAVFTRYQVISRVVHLLLIIQGLTRGRERHPGQLKHLEYFCGTRYM